MVLHPQPEQPMAFAGVERPDRRPHSAGAPVSAPTRTSCGVCARCASRSSAPIS